MSDVPRISSESDPPGALARLKWPAPTWLMPIWTAYIAWGWWNDARRTLGAVVADLHHVGTASGTLQKLQAITVGERFIGFALEAGFYAMWWRRVGLRLPYWRFACIVMTLSMCDLFGEPLKSHWQDRTGFWHGVVAVLAGLGTFKKSWPQVDPGLWPAFGGLGLLTLGRIAGTAYAQTQALARRFRETFLLTFLAWLATRLAIWWTVDLLRGRSPLP